MYASERASERKNLFLSFRLGRRHPDAYRQPSAQRRGPRPQRRAPTSTTHSTTHSTTRAATHSTNRRNHARQLVSELSQPVRGGHMSEISEAPRSALTHLMRSVNSSKSTAGTSSRAPLTPTSVSAARGATYTIRERAQLSVPIPRRIGHARLLCACALPFTDTRETTQRVTSAAGCTYRSQGHPRVGHLSAGLGDKGPHRSSSRGRNTVHYR